MKEIILTGDRPTGKLHIGHYIGSLKKRVELQETGKYDMFIMVADTQALTDNFNNVEKIKNSVFDVVLDYLSVGIDPTKTNIFIQSEIPEITELTQYFSNLVTVARLQRNPTVKTEIKQKKFEDSLPVGFFTYPISQAADIAIFRTNLVPAGNDQKPMIEQTRELVRSFNNTYNSDFLVEPEGIFPDGDQGRLIGIDGNAKMSKSLNNAIFLSDDENIIKEKVMKMYTDPNHIKVSDPGKVEGNVVFTYLDIFHKNKNEVEELKEQYRKGGLGDVKIKQILIQDLNEELEPIRKRRNEYINKPEEILEILKKGTENAQKLASNNMKEIRKIMGINYFG